MVSWLTIMLLPDGNLKFKISGRDRDWNFARSGEPVTTFLKF
jgi:hypothetical protein